MAAAASSAVNSLDCGVKFITADCDEDTHSPRISEPCLWQQDWTPFLSVDG